MENPSIESLKGKRVLIFQQRGWALTVGHFLAKKLQDEGAILCAFTIKPTTHQFIVNQKEVKYDLIVSGDEIKTWPKKYLAKKTYPLSEICGALGVPSIWPIVASARNHVRSYREKFYYGFKQNLPDEELVDYVMAIYKSILSICETFKPDVIIAPTYASIPHIMWNLFSKKHGIPMLVLGDSKVRGNYIFSKNFNYTEGDFIDRIDNLNSGKVQSPNIAKAKNYIADFRKNFKLPEGFEYWNPGSKEKSLWKKIRHFLSPFYQIFKWYTKPHIDYWENIGPSIDYRPPSIILRDHFTYDRNLKASQKYKYYPFEKLGKYVYFPLQTQPEEAIDVSAPFFNNQIEVARQVAMSLPDDYVLAVKEHPTMVGLRSPSYYEKLDRTPNVKLIDYRIPSEKLLLKTDLLIAPVGTTIAEAALLKKPAIQLGEHGTTLKLPNVWHHTDMTTLAEKIKEILKVNINTSDYEQKLENFVAAAYDTGLAIDYSGMWERGSDEKKKNDLWQFYKKEIVNNLTRK